MLGLEYLLVNLSLQGKLCVCLDCLRSGRRSPVSGWLARVACDSVTRLTIARMTRDTLFGHKGQQFSIPTSVAPDSSTAGSCQERIKIGQWEVWSCQEMDTYFYIIYLFVGQWGWVGEDWCVFGLNQPPPGFLETTFLNNSSPKFHIRISGEWDVGRGVGYVVLSECLIHKYKW